MLILCVYIKMGLNKPPAERFMLFNNPGGNSAASEENKTHVFLLNCVVKTVCLLNKRTRYGCYSKH